jgi:hypothetical protein
MRMAGAKPRPFGKTPGFRLFTDQFLIVMQDMSDRFSVRQTASA